MHRPRSGAPHAGKQDSSALLGPPCIFFSIFAQVSRSVTVRLKTSAVGRESTLSRQK